MTSIPESNTNENTLSKKVKAFFKKYRIGHALRKANTYKGKGVPVVEVLMYLVQLVGWRFAHPAAVQAFELRRQKEPLQRNQPGYRQALCRLQSPATGHIYRAKRSVFNA